MIDKNSVIVFEKKTGRIYSGKLASCQSQTLQILIKKSFTHKSQITDTVQYSANTILFICQLQSLFLSYIQVWAFISES